MIVQKRTETVGHAHACRRSTESGAIEGVVLPWSVRIIYFCACARMRGRRAGLVFAFCLGLVAR
jgi:hypothetical protein